MVGKVMLAWTGKEFRFADTKLGLFSRPDSFSRSRFLIEGKSRTMIKLAKLITEGQRCSGWPGPARFTSFIHFLFDLHVSNLSTEYVPLPAWASVTNFNLRYALTEAIFHWLGMSPRF